MAIGRPKAIDDALAMGGLEGGRQNFLPREEWAKSRGGKSVVCPCVKAIEAQPIFGLDPAKRGRMVRACQTASSENLWRQFGDLNKSACTIGEEMEALA